MPTHYKYIKDRIKSDEGYTGVPMYLSYTPTGSTTPTVETKRTGGWGHEMKDKEFSPPTSALADLGGAAKRHWEEKFEEDFTKALEGARGIIPEKDLDPRAFGILVEMVFQMGPTRVSGFDKTIEALKAKNYVRASNEMISNYDSKTGKRTGPTKWYRQTGNRALRASTRMRDLGGGYRPSTKARKGASLLRDPDQRMASLGRMARLA
jgi:hypothetical protein